MSPSASGFLLLDSRFALIASNREALEILAYPLPPQQITRTDVFISEKIGSLLLLSGAPEQGQALVSGFRSGKRRYSCCAYFLEQAHSSHLAPRFAVLLERYAQSRLDIRRAAAAYALTPREQETVEHLVRGLTTKEIAQRMNVSPSTVNAFFRLVMVKTGASSRSAVVQKMLRPCLHVTSSSSALDVF